MRNEDEFARMLDGSHKPSEKEIIKTIGAMAAKAWQETRLFLQKNYDFKPELVFYGKKYGWTIRYRKSGKTLCSLFPETGAFTVLIVIGQKDNEKLFSMLGRFDSEMRQVVKKADVYPDGRWLWVRVRFKKQLVDIEKLIKLKDKPKSS